MKCRMLLGCFLALGLILPAAYAVEPSLADSPAKSEAAKPAKVEAQPAEVVELFAAAAKGDIEVKLIPKDSTTGQVIITNKTKKPLTIQMPEAFAGVPVLAQLGGGLGGGGGNNNNNNNNQNQGMMGGMGGMGGMGMGGMGGGMGGGMFNVGPEKVAKLKFVGVCLEHGKLDPNPRVPYEMRPIESYVSKKDVIEIGKMLRRGEISQSSAQAAVWHLNNDMSWQELANKIGKKHLNGSVEPYFSQLTLELALRSTREAAARAEAAAKKNPTTPVVKSVGNELGAK
jgi:hypothetical protein